MTKYSKVTWDTLAHDLIFTTNPVTNSVIAKLRKNGFTGAFEKATIYILSQRDIR